MTKDNNDRRSDSAPAGRIRDVQGRPGASAERTSVQTGAEWQSEGRQTKAAVALTRPQTLFEQALNEKVTLKQGEKERTLTMAEAGIKQLIAQFAKGDRHARRDVFASLRSLASI